MKSAHAQISPGGRLRSNPAAKAVVSLLATLGLLLSMTPAIASAQDSGHDRSELYITGGKLTRLKDKSADLVQDERIVFSFNWDASAYARTDRAPKIGDYIKIDIPAWANFAEGTAPMNDAEGNAVAECVQKKTEVKCTFVTDLSRKDEPKGSYESALYLQKTQRIEKSSIQFGPLSSVVELSSIVSQDAIDKGVIGLGSESTPPNLSPLDGVQKKEGVYHGLLTYSEGKAIIGWHIYANGTGGDVTITDTFAKPLQPAQYLRAVPEFKNSVEIRYRDKKLEEPHGGGSWDLTSQKPHETSFLPHDQFDVEWSETPTGQQKATVVLKNTTDSRVYRVRIMTELDPSVHQEGDLLRNEAFIENSRVETEVKAYNVITAVAQYKDNTGAIRIFKHVEGIPADKKPQDYSATIEAKILRPGEQQPEVRTLSVREGAQAQLAGFLGDLPTGTQVTLTESASPVIEGFAHNNVVVGQGKYGNLEAQDNVRISLDRASAVVTIQNKQTTEVALTNSYVEARGKFTVTKQVRGLTANIPASFKVQYRCFTKETQPQLVTEGTIEVANGETKQSPELPLGIECHLDEIDKQSVSVDGYELNENFSHIVVEPSLTPETSDKARTILTNHYTKTTGGFSIIKKVEGDSKDRAPASFTFQYRCGDNNWTDITVEPNTPTQVNDVPKGQCVIKEAAQQPLEGVSMSTVLQAGDQQAEGTNELTFTVGDDTAAQVVVTATNTYTRDKGAFKITKVVDGDAANKAQGPFTFQYRCDGAPEWTDVTVAAGQTQEIAQIPTGQCEIKELAPAAIAGVSHSSVVSVADSHARNGEVLRFDVRKDADPVVTVQATNTYTQDRGELHIKKVVAGDAKNLAPASFSFSVRCGEQEWDNIEVKGGAFAAITNVPVGECVIKEKDAAVAGTTLATGFSVNAHPVTTDGDGSIRVPVTKGATVLVEATNTYTRETGSIELRKNVIVDGKAAPSATPFSIIARCEGMNIDPITVPGDGSTVRIDAVPTGTTCSFTEADAQRPGYAHGVTFQPASVTVNTAGETVRVEITNTYVRDTGGFSITKQVEGNAAALAPKRFHFRYTCADGVTGTVEVESGKPAMLSNIPTGECTITEEAAQVEHTTLKTHMSVGGGQPVENNTVTFSVTKDQQPAVAVVATNTYTAEEYPFMLRKTLSADTDVDVLTQRAAGRAFIFDYTCTPAYEGAKATTGQISISGDGKAVASPHTYPVGTTCTLTERADSATIPGFVHQPTQPMTVNVRAGEQPATVEFTNHYTRDGGGFNLAKKVEGWPWFATNTFTFNYRCEHSASSTVKEGTVEVVGNNTPVDVDAQIPFGSTCVITEDTQKAQRLGFVLQEVPEIRFILDENNKDHTFTATNTYIPWIPLLIPLIPLVVAPFIPQPAPHQESAVLAATPDMHKEQEKQGQTHSPQSAPAQLARTGVDKHLLAWVVFGALLSTIGVFMLRRREN
ncbi:DUF5979 domain-containing protein [Corynebacterium felinum]|uniref:DUF5979 domain-containing protein n=1 Tax=Corynebacterium felinum TaxID=131318 RepID=A0ABU2B4W4_9CORY|nr:DUF5979 domain-containing protein [Corynebacterium felinum]MDF5820581.1 DUF5979 domain-containing protein [Corynebacterium felinum]MDR7353650.1 hypothetical protein [Corynebacterium felinum]WJY95829.1 T surface-antigen of pili [Corynebacterium felinum]